MDQDQNSLHPIQNAVLYTMRAVLAVFGVVYWAAFFFLTFLFGMMSRKDKS